MAERVKSEIQIAKEKREVFSSATEQCQEHLEHSMKSLSTNVRIANKDLISNENKRVLQLNKDVNSIVAGFQEKVNSCNQQFDSFIDNACSLDYFDKWIRNIKGKLYDISHTMEEICQIEQDELRPTELSICSQQTKKILQI